jgi:hypothetical protein
MIEIFKTNVQNKTQARQIINLLQSMFSEAAINFDLHDRDKILRIDGIKQAFLQSVVNGLNESGSVANCWMNVRNWHGIVRSGQYSSAYL